MSIFFSYSHHNKIFGKPNACVSEKILFFQRPKLDFVFGDVKIVLFLRIKHLQCLDFVLIALKVVILEESTVFFLQNLESLWLTFMERDESPAIGSVKHFSELGFIVSRNYLLLGRHLHLMEELIIAWLFES